MKALRGMLRLVCLISLASVWEAAPARADVITQWNEQVFALGGASRTLAMVHVAMFDAFNAIQPRYQPYLQLPPAPVGALPEAAAASAAYGVLVRLLPARVAASERNARVIARVAARRRRQDEWRPVTATSSRTRCIKADSPTTSSCLGRSTFRQVYLARIKSPPLVPRSRSTRTRRTGFHSRSHRRRSSDPPPRRRSHPGDTLTT